MDRSAHLRPYGRFSRLTGQLSRDDGWLAQSSGGDDVAEVKLVMTWDIQDGKEREYIEFVVTEFGPGLLRLGMRITDAWYTQAGMGPQVVLGGLLDSAESARALMVSSDFQRLRDRLFEFVEDFRWRITKPNNSGFQL